MTNDNEDTLKKASALLNAERWDEAIALLVGESALTWKGYWSLGWAYLRKGNVSEAIAQLEKAARIGSDEPTAHWALAVASKEAGHLERAEQEFRAALAIREGYLPRFGLAFLQHEQGRIEEARATHEEGLRLTPDHPRKLEAYADFLSDIGCEAEAQVAYKKAERVRDHP